MLFVEARIKMCFSNQILKKCCFFSLIKMTKRIREESSGFDENYKRPKKDTDSESSTDDEYEDVDTKNTSNDWAERVRDSDRHMMDALKNKYEGNRVDQESELIKRKYLITYMKKVIQKLPMSGEIIDASEKVKGGDEFLKMYSVAKTCVHSELQLKKLFAFNSIFDMISHLIGKGLHDHYVTPYLKSLVSQERLDAAYDSFRDALKSDDSNISTELHCVAYLIQGQIDKSQPFRIPNPIYNRFTQQLKAASHYVTSILSSLASKPFLPSDSLEGSEERDKSEIIEENEHKDDGTNLWRLPPKI